MDDSSSCGPVRTPSALAGVDPIRRWLDSRVDPGQGFGEDDSSITRAQGLNAWSQVVNNYRIDHKKRECKDPNLWRPVQVEPKVEVNEYQIDGYESHNGYMPNPNLERLTYDGCAHHRAGKSATERDGGPAQLPCR